MGYYGLVYCATNNINNKKYIGQTTKGLDKRIQEHLSHLRSRTQRFYSAIKHYGIENFNWTIIEFAVSKEDLDEKEKMWIYSSQSMSPDHGYNMCEGGSFGPLNEEALLKLRKPKSEETKRKMSLYQKGRPKTKEAIAKMAKSRKGKNIGKDHPLSRKIINLDTGEIFECINSIKNSYSFSPSNISHCLRGDHKTAGGFHWAYYSD
jgi:group I intron endonuclease